MATPNRVRLTRHIVIEGSQEYVNGCIMRSYFKETSYTHHVDGFIACTHFGYRVLEGSKADETNLQGGNDGSQT
jgi:hypothetical protein